MFRVNTSFFLQIKTNSSSVLQLPG